MASTFANLNGMDRVRCVLSLPYAAAFHAYELLFTYLLPVSRATGDWAGIVGVYVGLEKSALVTLRKGGTRRITRSNIRAFIMEIKGRDLVENASVMGSSESVYDRVDASGRTVVDIGAYNGDSAIYFIKRKRAGRVLAFEPVEEQYRMAVSNVRRMRLGGRIKLFRQAVSPGSGRSESFSLSLGSGGNSSVTLDQVVRKFGLRGAVLKIDCEGCEYGLISHMTPGVAGAFDAIVMRYQKGYRSLAERLEELGYTVSYTKPTFRFASAFRVLVAFGSMYAIRKGKTGQRRS